VCASNWSGLILDFDGIIAAWSGLARMGVMIGHDLYLYLVDEVDV